jgi:hypothetical protein
LTAVETTYKTEAKYKVNEAAKKYKFSTIGIGIMTGILGILQIFS